MTPTRKPAPGEPDHHLERGRAEFDRVRAAGGDVMAAALAWINTSFDDQARADMLREREQRNRKMGDADYDEDCTCRTPIAHSADIDPPEYKSIRDPWCPVHGKDPDEEYEKMRERKWDR